MIRTTPGRILLKRIVPDDVPLPDGAFDKKRIRSWFSDLALRHPDRYVDVMDAMMKVSREAQDSEAGRMSISLSDFRAPEGVLKERDDLLDEVRAAAMRKDLSEDERDKEVARLLREGAARLQKSLLKQTGGAGNRFAKAIEWGIKGSPKQLLQMLVGDVAVANERADDAFPLPVVRSYSEGLSPMQAWAANYGGRDSLAKLQLATPRAGYFSKQIALMGHRVNVTADDCGASDLGVTVQAGDKGLLGRVLAEDAGGLKKGDVVTGDNVGGIPRGREVLVRSVNTCQQPDGVCRKCAGLGEDGHFYEIGARLGLTTSKGLTEPLTQAAIGSKHGGAEFKTGGDPEGLDLIDNLFQLRKGGFKGGAVSSPSTTVVKGVLKKADGTQRVYLNSGEELFIPEGREVKVARGDKVRAGHPVTDGVPDPRDVAAYCGLGEARRVMSAALLDEMRKAGADVGAGHLEPVTRGFLDYVLITDPAKTPPGYEAGDVALYSAMQARYSPRKGSVEGAPSTVKGGYLEKPVLHYTIGTPLTDDVVENLERRHVGKVVAHEEPPGFEPHLTRLQSFMDDDPNWKARQAGWYLKRNFLEDVRRGAEAPVDDSTHIPFLMNPFDPRRGHKK